MKEIFYSGAAAASEALLLKICYRAPDVINTHALLVLRGPINERQPGLIYYAVYFPLLSL